MARARTILLVDPDPASAALLGPALRQHGYQVYVARDGSRALQLAVLRSPDLVLLDDGTPLVSAPRIARILRSNPRTSAIPILRTGRGEPARPDEPFLRKPFDVDAVLPVVARALAGRADEARRRQEAGLEGSLEQLPLVDVVQMLSTNRRTGRLVLARGAAADLDRAEIAFQDGRVVDAAAGVAVGEKALVRLLAARSGQFAFAPDPVTGPERIARRTDELLLDTLRQADEIAALAGRVPDASAELVLAAAPQRATGPAADEVRRLVGSGATLRAVLDGSVVGDLDLLTAVATLLEAGEIAIAGSAAPPPRAEAPELLDDAAAHALRARLVQRGGTSRHDRGDREPLATKVLLAGAGGTATRAALASLSSVRGFAEVDGAASRFGTAGSVDLGSLRIDLVVLPAEAELRPLWSVLAAGAACALLLEPAGAARDPVLALARGGRFPVGACGPSPVAADDGDAGPARAGCGHLGADPVAAVRALLARAAGREPYAPA